MVNNLVLRTLSAIVLIPIVFLSIYLGGTYFQSFALLCLYLMLNEWFSMNKKPRTFLNIIFGIVIALLIFITNKLGYFSFTEIMNGLRNELSPRIFKTLSPYFSDKDNVGLWNFENIISLELMAVLLINILVIGGFKKIVWTIIGITTAILSIVSVFVIYHAQTVKPWPEFLFIQFVLLALIVIISAIFILQVKNKEKLIFTTGILYITLPMLFWISISDVTDKYFSFLTTATFATVWSCDIFAYLGGRLIGGPKLAPSISPKKTWSGAIVGAVMTLLIATFFLIKMPKLFYGTPNSLALSLCAIMIIASIFGDLLESKAKRILGVKDSGNLIPGHGGVLDRLDSFLMVSYVFIGIKELWTLVKWIIELISLNAWMELGCHG